jgi:hypothetical protein
MTYPINRPVNQEVFNGPLYASETRKSVGL